MRSHRCILKNPQHRGTKSELSTSPLPSRGPKRGRKCYVTPAFSGISNATPGSKIRSGPRHRGTKSKVGSSPVPSRVPRRGRKCYVFSVFSGIPNIGEQNQKWLPHPCLLAGPKEGRNNTSTCILGDPQRQMQVAKSEVVPNKEEQNQKWLPQPWPWGPKRGRKCNVTPAFSGIPNIGEENQKWRSHPCLLGCAEDGGNATATLHSEESPT